MNDMEKYESYFDTQLTGEDRKIVYTLIGKKYVLDIFGINNKMNQMERLLHWHFYSGQSTMKLRSDCIERFLAYRWCYKNTPVSKLPHPTQTVAIPTVVNEEHQSLIESSMIILGLMLETKEKVLMNQTMETAQISGAFECSTVNGQHKYTSANRARTGRIGFESNSSYHTRRQR